jgi:hypothetical protein
MGERFIVYLKVRFPGLLEKGIGKPKLVKNLCEPWSRRSRSRNRANRIVGGQDVEYGVLVLASYLVYPSSPL